MNRKIVELAFQKMADSTDNVGPEEASTLTLELIRYFQADLLRSIADDIVGQMGGRGARVSVDVMAESLRKRADYIEEEHN